MGESEDSIGHLTTEELFRQHAGFVTRFLARLGVPSEQLEDALQEVFLVVHRNGGYRPGLAKPTSYLASIALRAAAHQRQRRGRDQKRHSDAVVEHMPHELEDPAHALQVRQDLQRLHRVLARLPEELRAVLVLVEIEGESCLSVAAGLGCPVGTVYWRLHQARKKLEAGLQALDLPHRRARRAPADADERALPARSLIMLFGFDGFSKTEAGRLLTLARQPPSAGLPVDTLVARHRELVQSGAELPAWASGYTPRTASWPSLIGAGPISLGAVASGAALAVALLATGSPQPRPQLSSSADQGAVHVAELTRPALLAAGAPEEPGPVALAAAAPEEPGPAAHAPLPVAAPTQPEAKRPLPDRPSEAQPRAAVLTSRAASASAAASTGSSRAEQAEAAGARAAGPARPAIPTPPAPPTHGATETRDASAPPQPASAATRPVEARGSAREQDPEPRPEMSDAELAEMREIALAESLVSRDPARALALARGMRARFPHGFFREERAYLEVMALHGLGRRQEMREQAAAFLRAYPDGPYAGRVRKVAGSDGG